LHSVWIRALHHLRPEDNGPYHVPAATFPNNQIPGPLNQTASVLKSLTALPTNNDNPFIAPNFLSTYPDITRTNTYSIKVDQNFNDKNRLSVRYTNSWLNAALEGGYYANPIDTSSGMGTSAKDYYIHNVAVELHADDLDNLANELLVGVNRSAVHYGTSADSTNWPSKLGMPNPLTQRAGQRCTRVKCRRWIARRSLAGTRTMCTIKI